MKYVDGSGYVLSNGKCFEAPYGGVLGIDEDLVIYTGYDALLAGEITVTLDERKEIGAYMSNLWLRWARGDNE